MPKKPRVFKCCGRSKAPHCRARKCDTCKAKAKTSTLGVAIYLWRCMGSRAGRGKYEKINRRVTWTDYWTWFVPAHHAFRLKHPAGIPSIHRPQSYWHYEIGNMEIIDKRVNSGDKWTNCVSQEQFNEMVRLKSHGFTLQQIKDATGCTCSLSTISRHLTGFTKYARRQARG